MKAPTRDPWDVAQTMNQRLHRGNVAHRAHVDALLIWASWHLSTAQLGWDLLQRAQDHGDDNLTGHPMHTVEMAAMNLVFRGVVSAMDLCAAAIYRLTGEPVPRDRERDVGWWFDSRRKQPWHLVEAPLQRWLLGFDSDKTWKLASQLRDGFTHRVVARDITVTIGGPRNYVDLRIAGGRYEAEAVMDQLITYGKRRFSAFERALARSYPLPKGVRLAG